MKGSERKYETIELELMASVKGISAFRNILYGREFILLKDNKPLLYYKRIINTANIITRWLMDFQEYSFQCHHIPGVQNVLADYFSRTLTDNQIITLNEDPLLF